MPGKEIQNVVPADGALAQSFDDNYIVEGAHIDVGLGEKIYKGEYVDFSRLLPKDKVFHDDGRLEIVNRGGQTYFVPMMERDNNATISNFSKWEQAFGVYSNLFFQANPGRSSELIQYNHIIFTASQTFLWDNVYNYDREFRMHGSNYPERSWAFILQQAWSMCLKDRITNFNSGTGVFNVNGSGGAGKSKKEICKRFNCGRCPAGRSCKYDHQCLGFSKFGHGLHICRNKPTTSSDQVSSAGSASSQTNPPK